MPSSPRAMKNKAHRGGLGPAHHATPQNPKTLDRPCARGHEQVMEVRAIERSCSSSPSQLH